MTAAVITLAIALAALGGAAVVVAFLIRSLVDRVSTAQERERVAEQEQLKQEEAMDEAETQRDAAIEKATAAQAAADKALAQLAATQKLANASAAAIIDHLKDKVITADAQQLMDMANEQLGNR